ncbi:MAG TPA: hypothetical protein VHN39_12815 [Phenylobacterium sp.]|nr:hypothetical protein [Phenylobacterium sp.]
MILAAIAVAGTVGSLTDWLFMGVLFHDAYNRYPEVWREGVVGGTNRGPIIWSSVLGYLMTAGVVGLCVMARVTSVGGGLEIGALAWLAGPPVVIIVANMFVKMDPKITVAHCAGYAARLLLAGAAAGFVLARAAA